MGRSGIDRFQPVLGSRDLEPQTAPRQKESAMERDDVIATLNDLIETSRDGEEGFRQCAGTVKNPNLKPFFEQKAERCREAVGQLTQIVREMGGNPESGSSASGTMHR